MRAFRRATRGTLPARRVHRARPAPGPRAGRFTANHLATSRWLVGIRRASRPPIPRRSGTRGAASRPPAVVLAARSRRARGVTVARDRPGAVAARAGLVPRNRRGPPGSRVPRQDRRRRSSLPGHSVHRKHPRPRKVPRPRPRPVARPPGRRRHGGSGASRRVRQRPRPRHRGPAGPASGHRWRHRSSGGGNAPAPPRHHPCRQHLPARARPRRRQAARPSPRPGPRPGRHRPRREPRGSQPATAAGSGRQHPSPPTPTSWTPRSCPPRQPDPPPYHCPPRHPRRRRLPADDVARPNTSKEPPCPHR